MITIKRAFSKVAHKELSVSVTYPKKYLLKNGNNLMYLTNDEIASAVINQTKHSYLGKDPKWVFDATPGDCVLTRKLLESGAKKVRVFEIYQNRMKALNNLKKEYPKQLQIVDKQVMDFGTANYKIISLDRELIAKECFKDIPVPVNWFQRSSNKTNSIVFYSCLSPAIAREFVSYLSYALCHFYAYFMTGPTEFYLFMPFSNYKQLLTKPSKNLKDYTSFNILTNSLFEYKTIDLDVDGCKGIEKIEFEKNIYTTISSEHFEHYNEKIPKISEPFVLTKIKPNNDVHNYDQEFLMNYFNFVKQSFVKRRSFAVKYYEKHFPGSATELIGLEISYFKAFGDLRYDEMLRIFSYLYQTSQYKTSIFAL